MQPQPPSPLPAELRGAWHALLSVASDELRLRLNILADGKAIVTSLDQGNAQFTAETTRLDGNTLTIEFPEIEARYVGTWSASANSIAGVWEQGGGSPLTWTRKREFAPRTFPPFCAATIERLRKDADIPALGAALSCPGRPDTVLVAGHRSCDPHSPPVTEHDRWHVGSITKSMTATLVGRLVDLGLLTWKTTIVSVLGAAVPDMRAEYRSVTLLHLLSHQAGLAPNVPREDFMRFSRELDDARSERLAWARQALRTEPVCPAGRGHVYSNSGYVIAGAIVEATLHTTWEAALVQYVCAPLGLASVGFGAPGTKGSLAHPVGHAREGGPGSALQAHLPGGPVADNPAVLGPAGRMHISLPDLLRFLAAHRDRHALLRNETWEILHTPTFGGTYALGWACKPLGMWHAGSNTLWYAEVAVGRDGRVAAAAANLADARACTAVGEALLSAMRSPLTLQ